MASDYEGQTVWTESSGEHYLPAYAVDSKARLGGWGLVCVGAWKSYVG